jgi:prophage antirepressor-like protein
MNLRLFSNPQFGEIRIMEVDGAAYFVANDVARALGYSNPSKATNDHCKKAIMRWGNDSLGRRQEFKLIPEGDVYRLAAKSQLPGADEFESWIFDEVLVSIRNNGMYATEITVEKMISDPDFAIRLLTSLKDERAKRVEAESKIVKLQPKADFMDKVIETVQDKVDIGQAAKLLKLPYGRNTLFSELRERGIFFKNRNEPKQEYIARGYFDTKEKIIERSSHPDFMVIKVLVTQKGLVWLDKILSGDRCDGKTAKIV